LGHKKVVEENDSVIGNFSHIIRR